MLAGGMGFGRRFAESHPCETALGQPESIDANEVRSTFLHIIHGRGFYLGDILGRPPHPVIVV